VTNGEVGWVKDEWVGISLANLREVGSRISSPKKLTQLHAS